MSAMMSTHFDIYDAAQCVAMVDWARAELRPRPNNPKRRETFIPVTCPACGNERWLRPFDARRVEQGKRRICRKCQQHEAGVKGYAATTGRWGKKCAVKWLREYLLDHPRPTMAAVVNILDDIGVGYELEFWLELPDGKVYLIDAVVNGYLAVEADGSYVHSLEKQQVLDAAKHDAIRREGFDLLVITEDDVVAGRADAMLREYTNRQARGVRMPQTTSTPDPLAIPF